MAGVLGVQMDVELENQRRNLGVELPYLRRCESNGRQKVKIKITAELPVAPDVRPEVGSVHEVAELAPMPNGRMFYMINVGMTRIGVQKSECVVLEDRE